MVQNNHQTHEFYLFRSQTAFNKGYLPENILFRDEQTQHLMENLEPVLSDGEIVNTLLMGPAGTGKTSCVLRAFEQLKKDAVPVLTVVVNCQENRTKFSVIADIYLQITGITLPPSGCAVDKAISAICKELRERGRCLVVFLDDVDYLMFENALNPVFSRILRMCENNPEIRVGIIASVSDCLFHLYSNLDSATVAVLHMDMIRFPFYSVDEMTAILRERARVGLLPDVVSPELLQDMAERCCECRDVRLGIEMLRESALLAGRNREKDGAGRFFVLPEEVDAAYAQARRAEVWEDIRALPEYDLRLLRLMAQAKQNHPEIQTSGEVYEAVTEIEEMGYSTYAERIVELNKQHLVRRLPVRHRGETNLISLCDSPKEILGMCEDAQWEIDERKKAEVARMRREGWKRY